MYDRHVDGVLLAVELTVRDDGDGGRQLENRPHAPEVAQHQGSPQLFGCSSEHSSPILAARAQGHESFCVAATANVDDEVVL